MRVGDEIQQSAFVDEYEEAVVNLLFTAMWWERLVNQTLKPFGVRQEQYNVLRILQGNQGDAYCLQDIQSRLLNQTTNTTRVVEKLRQKGLLTRRVSKMNRRRVDICITTRGSKLLLEMNDAITALDDRIRNAITKEEAATFSSIADKMRASVTQ